MQRRELLQLIAATTGWAFIGGKAFAWGTPPAASNLVEAGFTAKDITFLDEIAETIIPKSDTPGAKDAKVGNCMAVMVTDCYSNQQRAVFESGMQSLSKLSKKTYQQPFVRLNAQQRKTLLSELDQQANEYNRQLQHKGDVDALPHYFTLMKQLTLFGFFTSKPGATQVLRYVGIPGRYDGNMPYKKGDRAWAT